MKLMINFCLKLMPNWKKNSIRTAVTLSYKIYGENDIDDVEPPILLLHDFLSNKNHWHNVGKTVVNMMKRSVVTVDLRNHGDSPHVSSHKYEELATDILHLLDKLSIKKASFVGHGMGGKAAMAGSLLAPEKVAKLQVVDVSPISIATQTKYLLPKVLASMKAIKFNNQKKLKAAKHESKKILSDMIKDDQLLMVVLSNLKLKSDGTIGWVCNLDVLIKHFEYITSFPANLRKKIYSGPTLFIGGQYSDNLPPDDLNGIREMFPRAVISFIPKTGHFLQIDDLRTFLHLTITFLRAND